MVPLSPQGTPTSDQPTTTRNPPSGQVRLPAQLLDLTNWYLTLPTGADGDPDTVEQPDLGAYRSRYFQLDDAGTGVAFSVPVDGVTTKNSAYPRTELREMNGPAKAAWSNRTGTHTLTVTQAVTGLPEVKPEVVTAQIHDDRDDVLQIRLEGARLLAQYADGKKQAVLDPSYRLGTRYDIHITARDNRVAVTYNNHQPVALPLNGDGWYFKTGAYVQSSPSKGEKSGAGAQVVIYDLKVSHE